MTKEEKRKLRQREAQARYRAKPGNKEKEAQRNKKYRSTPQFKEKRRLEMAQWRKDNHSKFLEISRKSWAKNADKLNAERRRKYKSDPEYRKKKIEMEIRYKATGRRKELRAIHAPKLRKRSAAWKAANPEKVKEYVRWYRDRYWIQHEREQRKNLDDRYVVKVIKKSLDYKIPTSKIPKELIELERLKIITKRSLKKQKQ